VRNLAFGSSLMLARCSTLSSLKRQSEDVLDVFVSGRLELFEMFLRPGYFMHLLRLSTWVFLTIAKAFDLEFFDNCCCVWCALWYFWVSKCSLVSLSGILRRRSVLFVLLRAILERRSILGVVKGWGGIVDGDLVFEAMSVQNLFILISKWQCGVLKRYFLASKCILVTLSGILVRRSVLLVLIRAILKRRRVLGVVMGILISTWC